jgi:hypothetical protein
MSKATIRRRPPLSHIIALRPAARFERMVNRVNRELRRGARG